MRPRVPGVWITVGMAIFLLLGVTGCVTSKDLDKLDAGLNKQLVTLDTSVQTQLQTLRTDLQTSRVEHLGQLEELKKTLEVVKAEMATANTLATYTAQHTEALHNLATSHEKAEMATANTLSTYAAQHAEALHNVAASHEKVSKQLRGLQAAAASVEQLPPLLANLGTELHVFRQTLLKTYALEEAALKERLRTLDEFRRQLEAVPARQPSVNAVPVSQDSGEPQVSADARGQQP